MKWHQLFAIAILAQPLVIAGASAQQAAGGGQQAAVAAQQGQGGGRGQMAAATAVGDEYSYPAGIAIGKSKIGPVFVDAHGMTLYQPNPQYLQRRAFFGGTGDPNKFCSGPCTETWKPIAAPADAKPTGYWKVVQGAAGPQWAYKNSPVFTYNADTEVAGLKGDGADEVDTIQAQPQVWKVVIFVPPVPKIVAPGNVAALFAGGEYVLADRQGHALYASSNNSACGASCMPFMAGMASQNVGDWTVARDGDRPQWAFRGKPVYVSDATTPALAPTPPQAPNEGAVLKP